MENGLVKVTVDEDLHDGKSSVLPSSIIRNRNILYLPEFSADDKSTKRVEAVGVV